MCQAGVGRKQVCGHYPGVMQMTNVKSDKWGESGEYGELDRFGDSTGLCQAWRIQRDVRVSGK